MTGWLRATLVAQLAFFAAWGAHLLTSHDDAKTVWLATEPVDPRDLLSGHYVALRYRTGALATTGCKEPENDAATTVYVRLETTGETMNTKQGPVSISGAVACQEGRPAASAGEHWITGQLDARRGRREVSYGIERFYVPETSALRVARSGSFVAKVALSDTFEARIVDLVSTIDPPDGLIGGAGRR